MDTQQSENKEMKTKKLRESIKPLLLFMHQQRRKKPLSQDGCVALYLCCPRLICDSLQPRWDPMGAGSGFTNLPVSETDARLQSGGHMGWRRRRSGQKRGGGGGL